MHAPFIAAVAALAVAVTLTSIAAAGPEAQEGFLGPKEG